MKAHHPRGLACPSRSQAATHQYSNYSQPSSDLSSVFSSGSHLSDQRRQDEAHMCTAVRPHHTARVPSHHAQARAHPRDLCRASLEARLLLMLSHLAHGRAYARRVRDNAGDRGSRTQPNQLTEGLELHQKGEAAGPHRHLVDRAAVVKDGHKNARMVWSKSIKLIFSANKRYQT